MSARLLSRETTHDHGSTSREGFYRYIDAAYTSMLAFSMRHRVLICVLAIGVMLAGIPLYQSMKSEYIPSDVDEAEFDINVTGPEGLSLASMNEAMLAVESEVRSAPGVRTVLANVGSGFLGSINQGGIYVRIAPHEERTLCVTKIWRSLVAGKPLEAFSGNYTQRDVMQDIRGRLRKYTHLRCAVRNAPSFNIGGGNFDIDLGIRGPEVAKLLEYANALRAKVSAPPGQEPEIPGVADSDVTLKLDKPEFRVAIDRARAADLGVRTTDISSALRLLVGGDDQVSRFHDSSTNEDYDVQIRLVNGERNDAETISRLTVPSSTAGLVRLDNLVTIGTATASSRIDRVDRQRQVSLRGTVAPGYALSDRVEALKKAVADLNMPEGYSAVFGGKAKEFDRTYREFVFAFLLSIAFMYMILASQFESLIHPVTILLSLPLAIPFALLGQWATGTTLNLYSALGILVLFGVVKKNSILQIDHMNNLRAKGMSRIDAIMQGNRDRLRPILMTTLTLVAGMLPLALGTGPGAEERRSVAVVVIAGQMLSLLLTLLVTPVAYSVFDDAASLRVVRAISARLDRARGVFGRKPKPVSHREGEAGD